MFPLHPLPYSLRYIPGARLSTSRGNGIQSSQQALIHRYADAHRPAGQLDRNQNRAFDPARRARQPLRQRRIKRRGNGEYGAFLNHALDVQGERLEGMLVGPLDRVA